MEKEVTYTNNMNSPIISLKTSSVFPSFTPAMDENMSGAPFPSARTVTPATFSESFNRAASTASEGQKL